MKKEVGEMEMEMEMDPEQINRAEDQFNELLQSPEAGKLLETLNLHIVPIEELSEKLSRAGHKLVCYQGAAINAS